MTAVDRPKNYPILTKDWEGLRKWTDKPRANTFIYGNFFCSVLPINAVSETAYK